MNFELATAYIAALTQRDPNTAIIDIRAIHDRDRSIAGRPRRGTLNDLWSWICEQNAAGFGIFVNISDMDGRGLDAANVGAVRCHVLDLDGVDAKEQYQRLATHSVPPAFAVQSSPNKFHVYWHTQYHNDFERFRRVQRQLIQEFHGDNKIHDPSRVLRLPGTYHHKGAPHLINCWSLGSYGQPTPLDLFDLMLAHVPVDVSGVGARVPLGSPELAAPSIEWLRHALAEIDPNGLSRGEWTTIIAATKQAGWSLADEVTVYQVVADWCARYTRDDPRENLKEFNSYRDTQAGWPSIIKHAPNTRVAGLLGRYGAGPGARAATIALPSGAGAGGTSGAAGEPVPLPSVVLPPDGEPVPVIPPTRRPVDGVADEILTGDQCREYFAGCVFVVNIGKMRIPSNRLVGPAEFNTYYGGKKFVIDSVGKLTDEPWKAATRSTLWTVPSVDHLRFVPSEKWGAMITDALGRDGLNIYYPITPRAEHGDVTPFLQHISLLIPDAGDQKILLDYMAHNVKYPGHKIPWAPVIQSGQGAGKGIIRDVMKWGIGGLYSHTPNAKELVESGSKFNGWMLHKLLICVDEIRVDERRELVEVLKPMISDKEIEIQKKGADQYSADNYANWVFFTNFKDAVPITRDDRRYSIFYSAVQGVADLEKRGMNTDYFDWLWDWLDKKSGLKFVTQYLLDYPIERGAIPTRAPWTTSMREAQHQTRSPLEKIIHDAIEDGITGFRGGYVSAAAVLSRVRAIGQMRAPSVKQVGTVLDAMGYRHIGRAVTMVFQEDAHTRPDIYADDTQRPLAGYAAAQGYR